MKRTTYLLLTLLVWCISLSTNAQCPNSLSGYTYLGEFENSKYFMSDGIANWNTASANAAANNGYLASITSQAENDFIFNNLTSIVFIGYNDIQNEGNFEWDSGESVVFDKFADTNTATRDYGKMNNWNGNWGVDNQYVSRKYIVEIPCGSSGNGITITSCPNDIDATALQVNGYTANVTWDIPTATTDCAQGGLTITQIQGPTQGFLDVMTPNGETVVYLIQDACGDAKFCTFDVRVQPEDPLLICPDDITVSATSATGAIVNYNNPIYQNFCTVGPWQIESLIGLPSGSEFPIGTTDVLLKATTSGLPPYCGTPLFCSFTVTVNPLGSGITVTSCPDDINVTALQVDNYSANVTWDMPTATTDCIQGGLTITQLEGPNQGNLGVTTPSGETVVYLIQDACGDSKFCVFDVKVQPEDPVLTCPTDITVTATSTSGAVVNYDDPDYQSFCNNGAWLIESLIGLPSGSTFPIGTTDVLLRSSTSGLPPYCGSPIFCSFTVTVNPPGAGITVTSCPSDMTAEVPHGGNYKLPFTWDEPTATTTCPGGVTIALIQGQSSGSEFGPVANGHEIVYQITNACGFTEYCIFYITPTPPPNIVNCLPDITVNATSPDGVVVNYGSPSVTSFCNIGPFTLFSGLPSGIQFPVGTTIVKLTAPIGGPPAFCQNSITCSFTVTVNPSGGGCPDNIQGFSVLGEFGDSKYFLSDGIAKPADAQAVAESNGGYLAVISSAAENDFIQQNIDIMPYIGLNDVASEGNLQWVNGEPLTYNNVDPCGFCEENSASKDYVIMAPWNGKWSFSSQWNSRPYVMEIPCDGGNPNQPDLTVSNLDNLPSTAEPGTFINFEFDLNNIGNATAVNSYIIGAYISTDNILSADDIASGEIPTANTGVGTDPNVPGAILVPNVSDGVYYLIVKADINGNISESNENNNTIAKTITIEAGNNGGCSNPPAISGFTYKVGVGNKAYYLSNGTDRPTDAEAACVSAGGHLATVTTPEINNALKSFTSSLVYIGLNDEDTEGTLAWRSGGSVGYTNFDDCSICEPNSANKDYVAMQGWNGKWSWSGFYNARKYWLEVDCNNLNSSNNSTLIALPTNERELLDFQKIVPNPANNHIFVQVKSETEMAIDVEIYDARGMLLQSQPAELFNGINAVEVNIADLPGGFYLVKIPQMKGQYATKRFVKVRD